MKQYCQMTPLNEWARYSHEECGDSRGRLYVKRYRHGWLLYCHNCDLKSHFIPANGISPSDLLKEVHGSETDEKGTWWVPTDLDDWLPDFALEWLRKYDITQEDTRKHGFMYSAYLRRLIMPVVEDGNWVYWQGRSFFKATKNNPKYLNVTTPGRDVFFKIDPYSPTVVIVEDILSAIKVGRVAGAIALLGSYMRESIIPILQDKANVVLWLDNDKFVTAYEYYKRLANVYCLPGVKLVSTVKDPKEQPMEEIEKLVWGR